MPSPGSSSPRSRRRPRRGCGSRSARSATCARIATRCPAMFAESIPLAAHQKAADYTVAKARLGIVDIAARRADPARAHARRRLQWLVRRCGSACSPLELDLARRRADRLACSCCEASLGLPLNLYRIFVIEERFGFNRMTLEALRHRPAEGRSRSARCSASRCCSLVLWLMQAAGPLWWLYAWVGAGRVYSLFLQMIYPDGGRCRCSTSSRRSSDPALAARVEALLARSGFRSRGLYVMDGSKRSSHGNAFFTGFGAAKRIVLFDTLVVAPAARPRSRRCSRTSSATTSCTTS